jgi:N-acetylglucosamine-6-phosphate deacetylase
MKVMDIHTHGIGGYDTRTSDPDHILRMAEICGSTGVLEILPAIYPSAIRVMRENMEAVKRAMVKQESDLHISGGKNRSAKIAGLHIEGPFLNPVKCGALAAETFIEPMEYAFRELIEGFEDIVKIITIAPELSGSIRLIKMISDAGIIASMGHSEATYAEAEEGFHAGARGITHIFNAMRGLHHREPGIAGFGLLSNEVYIEVIADPFHLHPKILDLILKTKDRDRIIIISDSVKDTKAGGSLEEGITGPQGKLHGGSLTITGSAKRLVEMGYDEGMIMDCITKNPERYLKQ